MCPCIRLWRCGCASGSFARGRHRSGQRRLCRFEQISMESVLPTITATHIQKQKTHRYGALFYLVFKISSAEQSRKSHSFANVESDGIIRPERYCETVGFDTPIAFAISLFDFPDNSISSFIRLLIFSSSASIFSPNNMRTCTTIIRYCLIFVLTIRQYLTIMFS